MDGLDQLDESGLALPLGNFPPAVAGDDLPEQRDFLHAARDEFAALGHDVGNGPAALLATRVGHDAEGAVLVAALHDAHERADGLVLGRPGEQMFLDGRLAAALLLGVHDLVPAAGEQVIK